MNQIFASLPQHQKGLNHFTVKHSRGNEVAGHTKSGFIKLKIYGSVSFYIIIKSIGGAIAAYPKGGGPYHKGGCLGVIKPFYLGLKSSSAGTVLIV